MTAIDKAFCQANAISCGVIQNVLEKAPGLVFVNGEFRHKYSLVSPSPPPLPSPPPRLFDYAPKPPSPPPPPGTPPPYYAVRKNSIRTNTQHTLNYKGLGPNTTKCNQVTNFTQPYPGRGGLSSTSETHRLRPGYHHRRCARSGYRGARKLPVCASCAG